MVLKFKAYLKFLDFQIYMDDILGSYYCDCPPGYTGKHCELKHDPSFCTPNTCLHGGTCELSANSDELAMATANYKCDCAEGFFGPHCERRVDICMSGTIACINGGVCVNGDPSIGLEAGCKCPAGFTGNHFSQLH